MTHTTSGAIIFGGTITGRSKTPYVTISVTLRDKLNELQEERNNGETPKPCTNPDCDAKGFENSEMFGMCTFCDGTTGGKILNVDDVKRHNHEMADAWGVPPSCRCDVCGSCDTGSYILNTDDKYAVRCTHCNINSCDPCREKDMAGNLWQMHNEPINKTTAIDRLDYVLREIEATLDEYESTPCTSLHERVLSAVIRASEKRKFLIKRLNARAEWAEVCEKAQTAPAPPTMGNWKL